MAAQPTFVPNHQISKHNFKVHAGLDFGTDGIGLAYSLPSSDKVFCHTKWANVKFSVKTKPKTIILLDQNHECIAVGEDALYKYMVMPEKKHEWLLFDRFKMALYNYDPSNSNEEKESAVSPNNDVPPELLVECKDQGKVAIHQQLTAANGTKIASSVVFIAAFKHLKKIALKFLKHNKDTKKLWTKLESKDIQWIVTVPAIWNDAAKYQMRSWIIEAGLVSKDIAEQCKIVYEPDCASLAIQNLIHKARGTVHNITDDPQDEDDDSKGDNQSFGKGEKYILVDAGGGTTDIACHEILTDDNGFGVREVLHPSGGPWGSGYIDKQYEILLENLFGDKMMA
eukprot:142762_1